MAELRNDDIKNDEPPATSTGSSWDHWLISRLIWMILAMVALAVMALLFMKVAYR